jgi:hypothetical protein
MTATAQTGLFLHYFSIIPYNVDIRAEYKAAGVVHL